MYVFLVIGRIQAVEPADPNASKLHFEYNVIRQKKKNGLISWLKLYESMGGGVNNSEVFPMNRSVRISQSFYPLSFFSPVYHVT